MWFDVNGNSLDIVYDVHGMPIGGSSGIPLNPQISTTIYEDWKKNADIAYSRMMSDYTDDCIPFFVSTDQHGGNCLQPNRYINNIDTVGVVNVNLGDSVTNRYNDTQISRLKTEMRGISRYIGVVGNHDAWKLDSITNGDDIPTNQRLMDAFYTTCEDAIIPSSRDVDYYAVKDDARHVKWVVLCPYYMGEDGSRSSVEIKQKQMSFLIDAISEDGYDSVVLVHQPLGRVGFVRRDGASIGYTDATATMQAVELMLMDYNNRRSGQISDDDGLSHSYNFSSKTNKVLCVLNGHWHEEAYKVSDGLTQYMADWKDSMAKSRATFGLINKRTRKMSLWLFDTSEVFDKNVIDI